MVFADGAPDEPRDLPYDKDSKDWGGLSRCVRQAALKDGDHFASEDSLIGGGVKAKEHPEKSCWHGSGLFGYGTQIGEPGQVLHAGYLGL